MNEEFDWITELLTIAKILQANGIDIASIPTRVSKNGTRHYLTLKEISSSILIQENSPTPKYE